MAFKRIYVFRLCICSNCVKRKIEKGVYMGTTCSVLKNIIYGPESGVFSIKKGTFLPKKWMGVV